MTRREPPPPVHVPYTATQLRAHPCYCGRHTLPASHTLGQHWQRYPTEAPGT